MCVCAPRGCAACVRARVSACVCSHLSACACVLACVGVRVRADWGGGL